MRQLVDGVNRPGSGSTTPWPHPKGRQILVADANYCLGSTYSNTNQYLLPCNIPHVGSANVALFDGSAKTLSRAFLITASVNLDYATNFYPADMWTPEWWYWAEDQARK